MTRREVGPQAVGAAAWIERNHAKRVVHDAVLLVGDRNGTEALHEENGAIEPALDGFDHPRLYALVATQLPRLTVPPADHELQARDGRPCSRGVGSLRCQVAGEARYRSEQEHWYR